MHRWACLLYTSIRGEKERSAVTRVQDAYGEKYDSLMMFDSKRDVENLLHEEAEAHSVRERLRQKQQTKTQRQRKPCLLYTSDAKQRQILF